MALRIRLFHKLFAAFVIVSFASVVLFAVITHWYMGASFLRYINEERATRLEAIATAAAERYASRGDWAWLAGDRRAWRRLLIEGAADREPPEEGPPARRRPPWRGGSRHAMPTLYDTGHAIVAGREPYREDMTLRAIVSSGQTVGWIGLPPLRRPASRRDVRFAERQAVMLGVAASVAFVLSIGIAFVTARRLARPIGQIGDAARALAGGRYDTRVATAGEDEIGMLASDFNVLARTLEENESARRRWIADISHELRTPLAIMRGEIEAVRDGVRDAGDGLVDSLAEETGRLTRLVDDLYQLASADIGALDYAFDPCSPGAILVESVNRFAHRFDAAGLQYDYDIDAELSVKADKRRLLQLLENIFENCCRYVDRPGKVRATVKRQGAFAHIDIDDSGTGVNIDDPDRLFEPLARGEHSRSREFGGSGLGLAICRRIAEAHGGSIHAAKSPLGGLRISVQLPLES